MPTGLKQLSPESFSVKQSSSSKETEGSFPPPGGASPMESRRLADKNHAASVPLRGKPFEINGSSGSAALTRFFVKLRRFRGVRAASRSPERSRGLCVEPFCGREPELVEGECRAG